MTISPLLVSAVFAFGLIVGSFLNVCIWRLPAGEQVVKGRSHCRSCRQVIRWYDNVPLISFFLLKGKCRFCRAKIAWSYPGVELITALLFVAVLIRFGWTPRAAIYGALGAALILLSVVDVREMILPDEITLPGLQGGVILSFFFPALHGVSGRWESLAASVVGALAGAGFLWVVGTVGSWVFKREAMGQGDVKLMAMVGSVIGGWKVTLVNFIIAPLLGSVVGGVLKLRYKIDLIPYGPFLAAGTFIVIFWGDGILHWYRSLIGV